MVKLFLSCRKPMFLNKEEGLFSQCCDMFSGSEDAAMGRSSHVAPVWGEVSHKCD